jgi:hypothetical protein
MGCPAALPDNRVIGRLSSQQSWWQHFYYVLKMSINRASTIFGLAHWKLHGLCGDFMP